VYVVETWSLAFFFLPCVVCVGEWLSVTQLFQMCQIIGLVCSVISGIPLVTAPYEIFPLASHVELAIYLFIYLLLI
jgi:hypothetical protein